MTMDAMDNDDDEVDNIPNILPPRPPTPTEFTPDLTVDLPTPPMDVSEMKDIQFGTDPQPGTSQNTVSQIQKLQVLSNHFKNVLIGCIYFFIFSQSCNRIIPIMKPLT